MSKKEIINNKFIKTKQEIDWANLKKHLDVDDDGDVIYKDTGEFLECIVARETLPSIEIKTEGEELVILDVIKNIRQ